MINEKRLLDRFLTYVQIDSPTKKERQFADFLMKEMKEIGIEVSMDDAGQKVGSDSGNVIGRLKGNSDKAPILFSAHLDTVSPGEGIKPVIKDGVVYSDGTTILGADDKAGIAAILEAVEVVLEKDLDHPPIEITFTIFEEGGLFGAKNLEYDKLESEIAFVLDSGGQPGEIVIQGPAQNKIDAKFIGKEAHAGVVPEEGISAIEIAAEAISNMKLLRIDEETTANIGYISGGGATNIVTNEVVFHGEARSLSDEKLKIQTDHMVKACQDAADKFSGKVELDIENMYGAFKVDEDAEIVENLKKAMDNLGFKAETVPTGGGSDTNILNDNGITAVNLGMGGRLAHTLEENIPVKDLEDTARLVLEIIKIYA